MNKKKCSNCLTVKPWNGLVFVQCVHVCAITIPHSSLSCRAVIHLRDGTDSHTDKQTTYSHVVSITFSVHLNCQWYLQKKAASLRFCALKQMQEVQRFMEAAHNNMNVILYRKKVMKHEKKHSKVVFSLLWNTLSFVLWVKYRFAIVIYFVSFWDTFISIRVQTQITRL